MANITDIKTNGQPCEIFVRFGACVRILTGFKLLPDRLSRIELLRKIRVCNLHNFFNGSRVIVVNFDEYLLFYLSASNPFIIASFTQAGQQQKATDN